MLLLAWLRAATGMMSGSMVLVRMASIIRPPDSLALQRDTTSLTRSSPYSTGILWRASTRLLIRFNCRLTILPSI